MKNAAGMNTLHIHIIDGEKRGFTYKNDLNVKALTELMTAIAIKVSFMNVRLNHLEIKDSHILLHNMALQINFP